MLLGLGTAAIGAPSPPGALLVFSEGQFNRQSLANRLATYHTDAVTLATVPGNVLRYEDRGDGFGPLALFEQRRTVINGRSDMAVSWTGQNGAVLTPSAATSPLGPNTAASIAFGTLTNSQVFQTLTPANVPAGVLAMHTVWARGPSGTEAFRWSYTDKDNILQLSADVPVTAAWNRYGILVGTGAGASVPVVRLRTRSVGVPQTIETVGYQMEVSNYPTSLMYTSTGQLGTVNEDSIIYLAAQVPLQLRQGRWSTGLYPDYGSADLVSGNEFFAYSMGPGDGTANLNGLRIRHTGVDVRLEAVVADSVVAASGALSFPRQSQLACVIDCAAGVLEVNAVPGAPGAPIVFPGGVNLRVGGIVGGHSEFNGRISEPVAA